MAINTFGMAILVWGMLAYERTPTVFTDVDWRLYTGYVMVNGPGLMIFYVGMTLLGLVSPPRIRGLMFSINGFVGAGLVLAS